MSGQIMGSAHLEVLYERQGYEGTVIFLLTLALSGSISKKEFF